MSSPWNLRTVFDLCQGQYAIFDEHSTTTPSTAKSGRFCDQRSYSEMKRVGLQNVYYFYPMVLLLEPYWHDPKLTAKLASSPIWILLILMQKVEATSHRKLRCRSYRLG